MLTYKINVLKKLDEMGYSQPILRDKKLLGQSAIQQLRSGKMVGTIALDRICRMTKLQPGEIMQYEEEEDLQINDLTYESMRRIKSEEDLPITAKMYSCEYEQKGRNHYSWYKIYDENFKLLENVRVQYTNAIRGLRRIVHMDHINDMEIKAYHLEKASDQYYYVTATDATTEILEAMCNSVKPASWN